MSHIQKKDCQKYIMKDRLIDEMIRLWGDRFDRVFEFGAGGGMLSRKLAKTLDIKELICNDIFDFFF